MKWKPVFYAPLFLVFFLLTLLAFTVRAPADFPVNSVYTVEKGIGLSALASDLSGKKIIRSPFLFKVFSVLFGGTKGIKAGDYVLNDRQNTLIIASRVTQGIFDLTPVRITFPEEVNTSEMAKLIVQKFPRISDKSFVQVASSSEGYLFPDTYLFLPNTSAENIVAVMKDNFTKKIVSLNPSMSKFTKPLADIIKMASIVGEEAKTSTDRKIVAGILWKRLALSVPLQVDSSFKYINGKTTDTLTLADLKINSPYNSYIYKGLPPTPISNPGLDAILATINPTKTDYLYFLSDKSGTIHYAKTYAEHLKNKELYL